MEPGEPLVEAVGGGSGGADDFHAIVDAAGVAFDLFGVKGDVLEEIDFGEEEEVGFEEDGGVFEGFVVTFGDGEEDDFGVFAEVVAGGADEVADVFDKEDVDVVEVPVDEVALDHGAIEVAGAASGDLFDGVAVAGEAAGVVVGLDVAGEDGYAEARGLVAEGFESLFKEGGFAGAGRRDEVEAEETGGLIKLAQAGRDSLVFAEDFLLQGDLFGRGHRFLPPGRPDLVRQSR